MKCQNILTVSGPPKEVTRFVLAVATARSAFSLEQLDPTPTTAASWPISTGAAPPRGEGRYILSQRQKVWRNRHWGTNREVLSASCRQEESAEEDHSADEERVVYDFVSWWMPPIAALVTASRRYPALIFHLAYNGEVNVSGRVVIAGGAIIQQDAGRRVPAEVVAQTYSFARWRKEHQAVIARRVQSPQEREEQP